MLANFLQQCDYSLGNAARDGSLSKPMVEHIRQNRHKHVRHPQVHFVGQTIQSRRLVEADLLQHITDFTLCNHLFAGSRFCVPKAGEVSKIPAKLLKWEIRQTSKTTTEMHPKAFTHLTARMEKVPIRRFNGLDVLMRKPSRSPLTNVWITLHGFVGNSF